MTRARSFRTKPTARSAIVYASCHSSESLIRVTHPSHSSEPLIRVTDPIHSSKPLIRANNPSHSSESLIRVAFPRPAILNAESRAPTAPDDENPRKALRKRILDNNWEWK